MILAITIYLWSKILDGYDKTSEDEGLFFILMTMSLIFSIGKLFKPTGSIESNRGFIICLKIRRNKKKNRYSLQYK